MSTSPYFNHVSYAGTQKLINDLIMESIKIYGYDVKYIPRTVVNVDEVYMEDNLSRFEAASEIEVYVKNVDNFAGAGKFLARWGTEIRDQITLTVSKLRYEQAMTESLMTEEGSVLHLEESNMRISDSVCYDLELGSADGYTLPAPRPRKGDLIYFGLVDKLFQIVEVDYETIFYQFGELQVYDMKCEVWDYSHETIDTGDEKIDSIGQQYNSDTQFQRLLDEMNDIIQNETKEDDYLLNEDYQLEDSVKVAQNEVFHKEAKTVVDWSKTSPFTSKGKKT